MDKVYLVLRNNQQSGPFTIGELLQQQLLPSDMIWIEGKSTAWTYLSELELAPFVKTSSGKQSEAETTRSSDEIEQKAEELRQRILSSAPKTYFPRHQTEIETYASPYKLGDNEIEFVDHRKERVSRRNTVFGEFFITCVVIGLFIVGVNKGKSFLGAKKQVPTPAAIQLNTNDAHLAQEQKQLPAQQFINDTSKSPDSALAVSFSRTKQLSASRKNQLDSAVKMISEPLPVVPQTEERKEETKTEKSDSQVKVPEQIPVKEILPPPAKKEINNTTETQEEKKGFLKGIFKNKKKEADHSKRSESNEQ